MSVEDWDDERLTIMLARHTLRQVAPQEMPMFRANSEAFFKNGGRLQADRRSGDDLLAFGTGLEVVLLTPAVLAVAHEVARTILSELAKAGAKEAASSAAEAIRGAVARIQKSELKSAEPPRLTREQLVMVHEVAYATARGLLDTDDRARLLADSTVGALALA